VSDGSKTWGGISIGCGTSAVLFFSLAAVGFFVVMANEHGDDAMAALLFAIGSALCSVGGMVMIGVGFYFATRQGPVEAEIVENEA